MALAQKKTQPTLQQKYSGSTHFHACGSPDRGFCKLPDVYTEFGPWISRGAGEMFLVVICWREQTRYIRAQQQVPDLSDWISVQELADMLNLSVDQVWDDLRDAAKRGLMNVETRRGAVRVGVRWRAWSSIPHYIPPKPREMKKPAPTPVEGFRFRRPLMFKRGDTREVQFPWGILDFECVDLEELKLRIGEAEGRVKVMVLNPAEKKASEEKKRVAKEKPESTPETKLTFSSPLAASLAKFGVVSMVALEKLMRDCQSFAPDCTVEEVTAEVERVGSSAKSSGRTRNVSAVVLSQVPKYFNGPYQAGLKPGVDPQKEALRRQMEEADAREQERRARQIAMLKKQGVKF